MVIQFDASGADDVRGRTWHASQKLEDRPDGSLLVKMTLSKLEEVTRWVLSFGEHATVIEPVQLKERVKEAAELVTTKYAKNARGAGCRYPSRMKAR